MTMISACTIVKNEAANMRQWLDGVKPFADEIIVVDTGSDDDTVAIAETGGAQVVHFPWRNDFSAAKNFAIEQTKGDWIVFLDADEYFPPVEVKKVRPLIEHYHPHWEVAGLMMRMDNIDKDSRQNMGTSFYQIRVFRHVPWLRYEGRVHEYLKNFRPLRKVKMQFVPDIVIYHTGYSLNLAKQKAERNLAMILDNQTKYGEKPLDDVHLADCYYSLKNWQQVVKYARRAIKNKIKAVGQENRPYAILIQSLMFLKADVQEIEQVIREAINNYPEAAEFWMLWGMVDWERKDWQAAKAHMEQGLAIYKEAQQKQGERLLANLCLNLLPLMYYRLGKLAEDCGVAAEALQYYLEAVKLRPYDVSMLCALLNRCPQEDTAGVIALLNQLYDKEKDAAFLVQVLKNSSQAKASLYYDRKVKILTEREKYLLTGHIREAAADLLAEAERYARLGLIVHGKLTPEQQDILATVLPWGIKEKIQNDDRNGQELQEILSRLEDFLQKN